MSEFLVITKSRMKKGVAFDVCVACSKQIGPSNQGKILDVFMATQVVGVGVCPVCSMKLDNIPPQNRLDYLKHILKQVRKQLYKDFEFLENL